MRKKEEEYRTTTVAKTSRETNTHKLRTKTAFIKVESVVVVVKNALCRKHNGTGVRLELNC